MCFLTVQLLFNPLALAWGNFCLSTAEARDSVSQHPLHPGHHHVTQAPPIRHRHVKFQFWIEWLKTQVPREPSSGCLALGGIRGSIQWDFSFIPDCEASELPPALLGILWTTSSPLTSFLLECLEWIQSFASKKSGWYGSKDSQTVNSKIAWRAVRRSYSAVGEENSPPEQSWAQGLGSESWVKLWLCYALAMLVQLLNLSDP